MDTELSRNQEIRLAMERAFEIQSSDNLKRKLKLYLDSVNDVMIVTKSMGLTKQQLEEMETPKQINQGVNRCGIFT